ncbi:hypothetical protein [Flavobacterium sp.]|uniref:hypothetical protein n=1 Tax=Flavobacterium sp. TaxID=239 RepID=UPI0040479E6F
MKKFAFSIVTLVAFSFSGMANETEKKVEVKSIEIVKIENAIEITTSTEEAGSLKCWAFGKWLRVKLNAVSENEELIDQTIDAAVSLCNTLDDIGLI